MRKLNFIMCPLGNSHRHENPKDSETKVSINVILDKGVEVGNRGS